MTNTTIPTAIPATIPTATDPDEMIPFGPVLVGQTEKSLQALLRRTLADTGLDERQWVALRLATMSDHRLDRARLVATVSDRAKFPDTTAILDVLAQRGLLADGNPTDAGRTLVARVLATSDTITGSIWRDLPSDDLAATTRILNEVLRRARRLDTVLD